MAAFCSAAEPAVDEGSEVTVGNPIAGRSDPTPDISAPAPGGHGLIGKRERLEAVNGSLTAGPDGPGTWVVRAVVPRDPR